MKGECNHTFLNDEHSKYLRKDITRNGTGRNWLCARRNL